MYPECIRKLIECFKKLPGIGEKSAERFVYYLLNLDNDEIEEFANALVDAKTKIHNCKVCNAITDKEICDICSDSSRSNDSIFVVERSKDINLFEKMGKYRGKYHVLNGLISPMTGVNPEDININSLVDRVVNDNVSEVIIVLKPSIEGETTMQYIKKILSKYPVKISKIPIGIPLGTDIEYLDSLTLELAFDNRNNIE